MRFCVQNDTPSFLSYKKNLESDKRHLMKAIPTIRDNDLKEKIITYMLEKEIKLTEVELNLLKNSK